MRLRQIKVRNFTSLVDVELSDLPDLVVLIGKNSSGKSNLIDAVALLLLEFGSEKERRLGASQEFEHLFPGNLIEPDEPLEIHATISVEGDEWERIVDRDSLGNEKLDDLGFSSFAEAVDNSLTEVIYVEKRLYADGDSMVWETWELRLGSWSVISNGVSVDLQYLSVSSILQSLQEFFGESFQILDTTDIPKSWSDRFSARPTIVSDDQVSELWQISQSSGNQRRPWTQAVQQYARIAPNSQRPAGVASSIQMEEDELSVPVGMTGEGSQAILRLIDRLGRSPDLVAIEEPEGHLHPALIKRVGQLLRDSVNDGKQLILSTHSPFLVDREALESFFVVRKEAGGTNVTVMADKAQLRDTLVEMGLRPSDVLFTDAILLVEGWSDEKFVIGMSNLLNVSLASRHVKIICAHGKDRGKYKIDLWSELAADADLPIYVILDKNASQEAEEAIAAGKLVGDRCLVLSRGDLEDYYPWELLDDVLENEFAISVDDPIPVGERVAGLRKLFGRRVKHSNSWKPVLADGIVQRLRRETAEAEFGEIADFLRKISHELDYE